MPGSEPFPVDLRLHRPAAVVAIDLEKHSTRDVATGAAIRATLEDVLRRCTQALGLNDVHFNHTGDGYLCALTGDSSARVLDFINAVIPELQRQLTPSGQAIRAGIDFGLVHLAPNALTQGSTHFDQVSVRAVRLEQSAEANVILCTATVRDLFAEYYSHVFSSEPRLINTKDRQLWAYEVHPIPIIQEGLREFLTALIYRRSFAQPEPDRTKLLIVDDERAVTSSVELVLAQQFPSFEIVEAADGQCAIDYFEPGKFAVVLTDLRLPDFDGISLTKAVLTADPNQVVILMTAFGSPAMAREFLTVGGFYFLEKPFAVDELVALITLAIGMSGRGLRQRVRMLSDDPGALWLTLQDVSDRVWKILKMSGDSNWFSHELLRHKAKQLVADCVARISPGADLERLLLTLTTQLDCILRLIRIAGRTEVDQIEHFVDCFIRDLSKMHTDVDLTLEGLPTDDSSWAVDYGDATVLIIAELLDNAIAAMDGRGQVTVKVRILRAAGVVQITVADSGPGIPEKMQQTVFQEGVSSKGPGRGLGLYLIRELVSRLGGSIEYARRNGSVFTVRLPLADSKRDRATRVRAV